MSFNGPKDVPGVGAWGDLRQASVSLVMRFASSFRADILESDWQGQT
jgi:hypothetical protein